MVVSLESKLAEIRSLCQRHAVRRMFVFGSAIRDDFDPALSDIDLFVEFKDLQPIEIGRHYLELLESLEALLERRVDMVSPRGFSNPYLRREIEGSRVLIYAA